MSTTALPRMILALVLVIGAATTMSAQLSPATQVVPSGFKVIVERNLGGSIIIEATKPNVNFPKPHMDQGIQNDVARDHTILIFELKGNTICQS